MTTGSAQQIVATVRSYDELREAIRLWCKQIGMTRAELDERAGLANGHAGKLLAPRAVKKFGNTSLRWVLAATGLVIDVRIDHEALAQIDQRIAEQKNAHVMLSAKDASRPHWRFAKGSAHGRIMNARRNLKLSPRQRSAIARKAALARWGKR